MDHEANIAKIKQALDDRYPDAEFDVKLDQTSEKTFYVFTVTIRTYGAFLDKEMELEGFDFDKSLSAKIANVKVCAEEYLDLVFRERELT